MKYIHMKRILFALVVVALLLGTSIFAWLRNQKPSTMAPVASQSTPVATLEPTQQAIPATTIIADHLDTPWGIALLPDGQLLVTERYGRVSRIDPTGAITPVEIAQISSAYEYGEGGLLGIALHPDFVHNHFVYLYYTYTKSGSVFNRVVRMTYADNNLQDEKIIVDAIPGSIYHDGGRIKFGPDGYLYIGTGDAQISAQAQNTQTLNGKILRVTDEGKPASGNPFGNDIYSYGHRNVEGLA